MVFEIFINKVMQLIIFFAHVKDISFLDCSLLFRNILIKL